MIKYIDLFDFELEGLVAACKREAWVHEKTAKHEDHDKNIAMARFFWRRTERWNELIKLCEKDKNEPH